VNTGINDVTKALRDFVRHSLKDTFSQVNDKFDPLAELTLLKTIRKHLKNKNIVLRDIDQDQIVLMCVGLDDEDVPSSKSDISELDELKKVLGNLQDIKLHCGDIDWDYGSEHVQDCDSEDVGSSLGLDNYSLERLISS
jgi:hypothetical protein